MYIYNIFGYNWIESKKETFREAVIEAIKNDEDFCSLDLSHKDLRNVDFRGVDLSGSDLTESYLKGADFRGANLYKVDLCGANLRRAFFDESQLKDLIKGMHINISNAK